MEQIKKIMEIIEKETDIPQADMQLDSALMDDLDLSSMEVMSIIGAIEVAFGVTIPEREFQNIVTISDLAEIIARVQV